MDRLVHQFQNFSLWRISQASLKEACEFVVGTNYLIHKAGYPENMQSEAEFIHNQESRFFDRSVFYAARNNEGRLLGTIRILHWEGKDRLPIQDIFDINIGKIVMENNIDTDRMWHAGCFAINARSMKTFCVSILKALLSQAAAHVCMEEDSLLLAECDRKLCDKLKLLNVVLKEAGKSKYYIGSETVPVYSTSNQLKAFLWEQRNYIYINGTESIFPKISRREYGNIGLYSEAPALAV